jgi:hypothetical protein
MYDVILGSQDFSVLSREILDNGGTLRFKAGGGSMWPFIQDGAVLTVAPAEPAGLRAGDIVLYRSGDKVVAHRLLLKWNRKGASTLVMRGDALSARLELVPGDGVMGRVVSAEHAGTNSPTSTSLRRFTGLMWALIALSVRPFLTPLRVGRSAAAKWAMAVRASWRDAGRR